MRISPSQPLARLRSSLLARNSSCSAFAFLMNSKYRPRRNSAATTQASAGLTMNAMIGVRIIAPQIGSEPDASIDQLMTFRTAAMIQLKMWSLVLLFILMFLVARKSPIHCVQDQILAHHMGLECSTFPRLGLPYILSDRRLTVRFWCTPKR